MNCKDCRFFRKGTRKYGYQAGKCGMIETTLLKPRRVAGAWPACTLFEKLQKEGR